MNISTGVELMRLLISNPNNDNWMVFIDWLTEQNDVLGECLLNQHIMWTYVLNDREVPVKIDNRITELTRSHQQEYLTACMIRRNVRWRCWHPTDFTNYVKAILDLNYSFKGYTTPARRYMHPRLHRNPNLGY